MSRVTPWVTAKAGRTLASALVAMAAVSAVPSVASAADDLSAPAQTSIDARAAEVQQATTLNFQTAAPAPAAAKKAVPNFTARGLTAIRATRSASLFRWGTASYAKWYAKSHVAQKYHWGSKQFGCLVSLWNKESHWSYRSVSHRGHTYGIPQTNSATIKAFGTSFTTYLKTPELQVQVGAKYINYRYGSPCTAWSHSKRHGWY